jgi:hypothetical protein
MQIVILFSLMGLICAAIAAALFGVGLFGLVALWAVTGPIAVGLAYARFVTREAGASSPMTSAKTI